MFLLCQSCDSAACFLYESDFLYICVSDSCGGSLCSYNIRCVALIFSWGSMSDSLGSGLRYPYCLFVTTQAMSGTEPPPPPLMLRPVAHRTRIELMTLRFEWNAKLRALDFTTGADKRGSVEHVSQIQQINTKIAEKFESLVGHDIPRLRLETAFTEALAPGVQPASQPCSRRSRSRSRQRWGGIPGGEDPETA